MTERTKHLEKVKKYCAYQERCHSEVRKKLNDMGVYGDVAEELIVELISENYLNEQRYALTYAGGKFRQKAWGKNRIRFELQQRNVSEYCIQKAVDALDEEEYRSKLSEIVENQLDKFKSLDLLIAKNKTLSYCTGRGYEIDLVLQELRKY